MEQAMLECTQSLPTKFAGLIEGKSYICYSLSRKKKGETWFEIAKYSGSMSDTDPCFIAMCFFPAISELDLVIDPDSIPDDLWQPLDEVQLKDNQCVLYTYKHNPTVVNAGEYTFSMCFGRYQGYSGPYISGTPTSQFDKIITLDRLIEWERNKQ